MGVKRNLECWSYETLTVNGMGNERANGSETGTGIENRTTTEHANGSESEIGIKNETMERERETRCGSWHLV